MKLTSYKNIPLEDVNIEGAKSVKMRWLIAQKDDAPNFAMRMFEVSTGGFTPYHTHSFEHEVFVVEGKGIFVTETEEIPFEAGDIIFVDPDMKHQFRNAGETTMKFLCLVPLDKPAEPVKTKINPFATGKANNC